MSTPHKYAAVIHAWADGKAVQWKTGTNAWHDDECPSFAPDIEWRIKPDALRYRVALFHFEGDLSAFYTATADNEQQAAALSQDTCFLGWKTDWVEYEA